MLKSEATSTVKPNFKCSLYITVGRDYDRRDYDRRDYDRRDYDRRDYDRRDRDYDRRDRDFDRAPRRRPNTPPADYPDMASDLQVFARQYNNYGDEYFYGGNTGRSALERDLSPSRWEIDISVNILHSTLIRDRLLGQGRYKLRPK